MHEFVRTWQKKNHNIHHLSQTDEGFRKNRALNRAIAHSNTDHIIFIDGDCIPHPGFIKAHQTYRGVGIATAGRRVELGPGISGRLRNNKMSLYRLFNRFHYFILLPWLLYDKTRHTTLGLAASVLQRLTATRNIRIVGCNFSCNKQDLYEINGFNEEYTAAGLGEDSDIEWRLRHIGVEIFNTKFSAVQYHLYHERWYNPDDRNREILEESLRDNRYYCKFGLSQHRARNINPE